MKFQIIKAKSSGFCFGVRRALKIAKEVSLQMKGKKNIYMLGDIVHNEFVINEIKSWGIKKVNEISQIPSRSILIIKAHGVGPQIYKEAKNKKLKIIDATCPMVKEIHQKAQDLEKRDYKVIIIGDKEHEEVIGICGYLKDPLVVSNYKEAAKIELKSKKIGVVCQSTQNIESASLILRELSKKCEELIFINTICTPTRIHQKEAEEIAQRVDLMFVIGSKRSANTKRLFKICKKVNKNTYWIENAPQIKKEWLEKIKKIGITAGASTPDYIIQEVINTIRCF